MAWLRRVQQSIRFTRINTRSFFTNVVPVDDHITGLNDTQQQVCHERLTEGIRTAMYLH